MEKIILNIRCKSCSGTGVYVGLAERDGAAVVCHICKGTGKQKYVFSYEPFTARMERDDVKRVYKDSYGYCIAPRKIDFDKIGEVDLSKEGVSYEEFFNENKMPKHIRKIGCPMVCDQGTCHDLKTFTKECNKIGLGYGSTLKECKNYHNRSECWMRFDSAEKE